jgi:hypothetical protein
LPEGVNTIFASEASSPRGRPSFADT